MSYCNDRWRHEQEGRDAARFGPRFDHDHNERMREARYDSYSCDAAYANGYERELRHQEEMRQEERQREQYEHMMHERYMAEQRAAEEAEYYAAMEAAQYYQATSAIFDTEEG